MTWCDQRRRTALHRRLASCPLRVGIAFSGGPDSRLLLEDAHLWATATQRTIKAFIVDHGIQNASAQWSQQAQATAHTLGIDAEILPLTCKATQAHARTARYEALWQACYTQNWPTLLLGHHQDDNLETLWMRYHKGSGPYGLGGMSFSFWYRNILCIRPYLFWPKKSLPQRDNCILDPANTHPKYLRTHARQALAQTLGIKKMLGKVILRYYRYCRHTTTTTLNAYLNRHIVWHQGCAYMDLLALDHPHWRPYITLIFRHVISLTRGRRWNSRIFSDILTPNMTRTLGGCLIKTTASMVQVSREYTSLRHTLEPHQSLLWDHRWMIRTSSTAGTVSMHPKTGAPRLSFTPLHCQWIPLSCPYHITFT